MPPGTAYPPALAEEADSDSWPRPLAAQIFPKLDECCVQRAVGQLDKVRKFAGTRYAANSWTRSRRVVARIEATPKGADVRYAVTNLK